MPTSSTTELITDIIPSHIMLTSSNLEPIDEGELGLDGVVQKEVRRGRTDVGLEHDLRVEVGVRFDGEREMPSLPALANGRKESQRAVEG